MKTKYYIFFFIYTFSILYINILNAQPKNNYINDVAMPAPNAAALGKYGDIPVSYFTGTPNIDVPIYTLQEGPLSLPVSLSYHASGLKIGESASWVGAGWSLNAGGVVTRTVIGIKDDGTLGYYFNGSNVDLSQPKVQQVIDGQLDAEPDVFTFNMNGYAGKFFFDKDRKCNFVPKQDLKVEVDTVNFDYFVITPPDGTRYIFGKIPGTSTTAIEWTYNYSTPKYKTSWYLLRVETPDKKYKIDLSYLDEQYSYPYQASCNRNQLQIGSPIATCGSTNDFCSGNFSANGTSYSILTMDAGKRLTQISTTTASLQFVADTTREDLDAYNGQVAKRLDEIQVNAGTFCSKWKLKYDYFQDNTSAQCISGAAGSHCKKLKLDEVKELSCDGLATKEPYKFEYEGTTYPINGKNRIFVANRLSKAIDHWGYYNRAQFTNDNLLINVPPTVVSTQYGSVQFGAANRETDETGMKDGILKKITYPTSGHTEFKYQANSYTTVQSIWVRNYILNNLTNCSYPSSACCVASQPFATLALSAQDLAQDSFSMTIYNTNCSSSQNCYTGPVSVDIQVRLASNDQLVASVSYHLTSGQTSGIFEKPLSYFSPNLQPNVSYKFVLCASGGKGTFSIFKPDVTNQFTQIPVGGLRVQEIKTHDGITTANDIIKTYEYTSSSNPSQSSGKLFQIPKYGYSIQPFTGTNFYVMFSSESVVPISSFQSYHVGYQRVIEYHNGNGKAEYIYYTEDDYNTYPSSYPFTPLPAYVIRGNLNTNYIYDSGSTLKSQNTNTYNTDYYAPAPGNIYKAVKIGLCDGVTTSAMNTYTLRSAPYRIASKTEMIDGISTTTNYNYASSNHLAPIAISMTNSDGKIDSTKIKYAYEMFAAESSNLPIQAIYQEMIYRNMIGIPIEQIKKIDGNEVNGTRTDYRFFNSNGDTTTTASGSHPYPRRFWTYERTWTGGAIQPGAWIPQGVIDKYYSDTNADAKGYPQQFTKTNWLPETYEWDNGLIKKRTYSNFNWIYNYYTGTRLLSSITDIDGQVVSFAYDKLSRLKTTTARGGNVITNYTYQYKDGSNPKNYVETITNFTPVSGSNLTQQAMRQYLDGLGRPMQEIKRQYRPTKGANGASITPAVDVITNVEYDIQGRLIKTTRPYLSTYTNGTYYAPPGGTEFTSYQYENSPLNRVLSVTPPNGYATTTAYGNNANAITVPGTGISYAINTLMETKVTDPDNRVSYTYTDKKGRVVLSKLNDTNPAETYNIYDDKDRIEKVIPPGATLSTPELIFTYEYSGDDLLLNKKVPGAAVVNMRYNNRDLLRLTQDGNLAANSRWLLTNYDDYGRPIKTGRHMATNPDPNNASLSFQLTFSELFYDGYDGNITLTAPQYMGKVRKSKIKVIDLTNDIENVFTYDVHGRVISSNGNSLLNSTLGSELISYAYDWAGNKLTEERFHNPGSGATTGSQTIKYEWQYDQNGRFNNYLLSLNSQFQHIAEYSYNFYDEMIERNVGSTFISGSYAWLQSIDYTYNNMSWLTKINSNGHTGTQLAFPSSGCSVTMPSPSATTRVPWPESNDLFYLELRYDQLFANNTAGGDIAGMGGTAQKAGNISQLAYRVRGRERQSYSFTYDYLSRLTAATSYDVNTTNTATNTNRFNESLTYDIRGNINALQRQGYYASTCGFDQIDNLTYTYTPNTNRIASIADNAPLSQRSQGFNPGSGGVGYTYDANGNLKSDSYKGISTIFYNHLNLPSLINFTSGNSIEYKYDAGGNKLRKTVKVGAVVQYEQYYVGGVEYRKTGTGNTRIEAIYHSEGRYANIDLDIDDSPNWRKEYNIKDHLGNTRLSFADKNGNGVIDITNTPATNDILQENHYYPFGLSYEGPWLMNDATRDNKYQYNGKELNDDFGLNWYDYGARFYDPAIGRWGQVDPMAESYYPYSPYNYTLNNPLRYIDPDGMSVFGDIYNRNGTHIGNDGVDDNKVYVKSTTDDTQLTQEQAAQQTAQAGIYLVPEPVTDLTATTGITHEEFQQFGANVYNEAPHETFEEKEKVASAIVNRKETHSLGGTWEKTLDRIMFAKDNHDYKMSSERANPQEGEIAKGTTSVSMTNVGTENYQSFYNTSPTDRNNDAGMKDATKATINGLTGPDKVKGANEWRGRGQGNGNRFFKEN